MNATVAWSYQLLGPNEQRVFRRLGMLAGRFPIEAAASVVAGREGTLARSDEALGAAAGLIDKSLLMRAESTVSTRPRYHLLKTVRAYAALELAAAGERDDALEGLEHYCVAEASLAADGPIGAAQVEWLIRVRQDLESYHAALTWPSIATARPKHAHRLESVLLVGHLWACGQRVNVGVYRRFRGDLTQFLHSSERNTLVLSIDSLLLEV
jgi:predicted ATPase